MPPRSERSGQRLGAVGALHGPVFGDDDQVEGIEAAQFRGGEGRTAHERVAHQPAPAQSVRIRRALSGDIGDDGEPGMGFADAQPHAAGLKIPSADDARPVAPTRQRRGRAGVGLVPVAGRHEQPVRMDIPGEGENAHAPNIARKRIDGDRPDSHARAKAPGRALRRKGGLG